MLDSLLPEQPLIVLCLAGFLLALIFALVLVPWVRRQAMAAGYFDAPDERKIHKYPIPRLGGLAIWSSFMLALWSLSLLSDKPLPMGSPMTGILAGGTIMFILGLLDDLMGLSPYFKLGIQVLAAVVAYFFGVAVMTLDLPGSKLLLLNFFALPVTLLWIVGLSNAMNFIDGMDGLAAGITTISALTLVVIAFFTMRPSEALMASILVGSTLGFLAYNYHPAKIFMGDSGSLFCGFMLATIAVTGVLKSKIVVMLLPLFILSVPILDITFAVTRRLIQGKNPFLPDAEHIHHKLLKAGIPQGRAVRYFYTLCVFGGFLATWYIKTPGIYLACIAGLTVIAASLIAATRYFYRGVTNPLPAGGSGDAGAS
ncbi:MAG: glycosyltransferase family 4 protein [Candidatus Melainabacteria bacterium]